MKMLHFRIRRKTFALISLLLCSTVLAEKDKTPPYEWAYRLRESVQQVPNYTEAAQTKQNLLEHAHPIQDTWVWGTPKNLLEPIASTSNARSSNKQPSNSERQKNQRGNGSGNGGSSNASITVNISPEGELLSKQNTEAPTKRSRLEELYSGDFNAEASRNLQQFGYNLFQPDSSELFPTGPTPGSYILGTGDEILIALSGNVEANHQLIIDNDGLLNIPEFGATKLAGVEYRNLHKHLKSFFEKRRHSFELTVSLASRRSIQINVLGRVANPGRIEVPALSNLIIALSAAGGVNKDGSLRKILHIRHSANGDIQTEIDLYDYLLTGNNKAPFPQLQELDTLHIPAIGTTIGVAGYVQRPAIYEVLDTNFTVAEALKIAGGLTPFSFTPLAQIERTIEGRGRKKSDIELTPAGTQIQMNDGELLMVEAVDDQHPFIVSIEGEIARPGDYEYTPGMTLSDLVKRANGLTVDAYLEQAFISRQISELEGAPHTSNLSTRQQTKQIIVAELDKAIQQNPQHDIALMPLDLITVRSKERAVVQSTVEIIGSVQKPGKYQLTQTMRVSDLVAIAGNLTPEVYYEEAELIRRYFDPVEVKLDIKRYRFDLKQALNPFYRSNNTYNPILADGDKLVIRSLQNAQIRVQIQGRVRFPGEYIFPEGAKITDLIKAAGGILDDADIRSSIFTRVSTKRLQQTRLDNLVERTRRLAEASLERMVQTGRSKEGVAAKIALEQTKELLARMSRKNANGRIVIPFEEPDFPETDYNLPLQSGDSLTIPRSHPTVSVSGDVFRPITFIVLDKISVKDALEKAGGLTEMADEDLLYIIRANGEIERSKKSKGFVKKKSVLYAGDILLAPTQPMKRTLGAHFTDLVMLTRQLAEIAVITTNGDEAFDVSLVSPFTPEQSGINANVDAAVFIDE